MTLSASSPSKITTEGGSFSKKVHPSYMEGRENREGNRLACLPPFSSKVVEFIGKNHNSSFLKSSTEPLSILVLSRDDGICHSLHLDITFQNDKSDVANFTIHTHHSHRAQLEVGLEKCSTSVSSWSGDLPTPFILHVLFPAQNKLQFLHISLKSKAMEIQNQNGMPIRSGRTCSSNS